MGELAFVAGWGITNITTQQTAKILKFVQVMVKNNVYCKSHWKAWFSPQTNICAGNNAIHQDACQVNDKLLNVITIIVICHLLLEQKMIMSSGFYRRSKFNYF